MGSQKKRRTVLLRTTGAATPPCRLAIRAASPRDLRGPFPLDQTKEALRVRVVPSFRTHPRAKLLAIRREAATVTITRVRNLLENGPQIPVLSKRPVRIEERKKPPASVCLTDAITPNPV